MNKSKRFSKIFGIICCFMGVIMALQGCGSNKEKINSSGAITEKPIQSDELKEPVSSNKAAHLSFDDTYLALKDITDHQDSYSSIFDCEEFAKLKKLHDTYGAKFSMFCFETADGFSISEVTTKFKKEFEKNSDWLKFGFHGKDKGTHFNNYTGTECFQQSFDKVQQAIISFAGSKSLCKVIRIHYFECTEDEAKYIKQNGISALLSSDDKRTSYDLTQEENNTLLADGVYQKELMYYQTNIRLENVKNLQEELEAIKDKDRIVIFTHEYVFDKTYAQLEQAVQWLAHNGYIFSFYE